MPAPRVELLLARHADTAWRGAIRPWLESGHGRLVRSYVVVATRGQAQGLKQRCVAEELALLGVEFLTPGLARKKWQQLVAPKPALGRELLLFELRVAIANRIQSLDPDDPSRGLLRSLQSDAEHALDDFDELLEAGFSAADFTEEPLREVFGQLVARVEDLGYGLGARQSELAALEPVPIEAPRIGGRLLVYGLGAESWGEFFNVAAFVRRFEEITVVLPEPEFRGNRALDEKWVEVWQTFLGVGALPIDSSPPTQSCSHVAGWWRGAGQNENEPAGEAVGETLPPRIVIGRTRDDEMKLVAGEVVRLIDGGARDIAVVFPKADAAQAGLVHQLTERGIDFVNLLPGVGPISLEAQLQRAVLAFYVQGGRLEELLVLWPLLRASGLTELSAGSARDLSERLFDERQTHGVTAYTELLAGRTRPEWKEVNRVVSLLLPVWPAELTLADAVARFQSVCERLDLIYPETWAALAVFAERETRVLPIQEVLAVMTSFLPEKTPASGSASNGFARVTLTTLRRAEGLTWSHIIFVESNVGVWPTRQRASAWLTDAQRAVLNARSRFSLGVFSADDRAWLEKRSYAALARDTLEQVVFSAALVDEAEPENKLAPNSWLERVIWHSGIKGGAIQEAFEQMAMSASTVNEPTESVKRWLGIAQSRRDPARAFDDYFLSVDPARIRPDRLAARLLESAVSDPAELWFGAVLGVARVKQGPLMRSRSRSLGQLAHRVVAAALRGDCAEGSFFERPEKPAIELRLTEELRKLRALWPDDRFWDSFHAGLAQICVSLLENLFQLPGGRVVATELRLPAGATVPLGAGGGRLAVSGRMDVVIADGTDWVGADVDVVDFKTGGDAELSAARMAARGAGLQLGIYLAAVQSLGAKTGRVWMLKPEEGGATELDMSELATALLPLERIARHLASGHYGALTPDKSAHSSGGFVWPFACAPIPVAVLREKFAATFGEVVLETEETANE